MPDETVPVAWQIAEDERLHKVVRRGTAHARTAYGHSVHVDVRGLRPGRTYWYRFRAGGRISPTSRTRPRRDARERPLGGHLRRPRTGDEDWLDHMLRKAPYEKPSPSFWHRHRHDRLVGRWSRAVGPDRMTTVVVVDDSDRDGLLRTFEALLGLPGELLQHVPDAANRSFTLAETEMLRKLNVEFRGNGLPDELYSKLIRNGAVMHMKNTCSPTAGDVKIRTPGWAVEAAARIGAEIPARIDALGVRVVGEPRPALRRTRTAGTGDRRSPHRPGGRRQRPGPCTRRHRGNSYGYWVIDASRDCDDGEPGGPDGLALLSHPDVTA